jgi:uncharacterized protein YdhG (YjbR/CyaY superfamily)
MRIDTNVTTIDAYIEQYPKETQQILKKIRKIIRECAPGAKEKISYGIPTFTLGVNLVHFGAYPNHIGFYPTPEIIAAFTKEIKGYTSSKGSVQFPLSKPMPYNLIKAMAVARMAALQT